MRHGEEARRIAEEDEDGRDGAGAPTPQHAITLDWKAGKNRLRLQVLGRALGATLILGALLGALAVWYLGKP